MRINIINSFKNFVREQKFIRQEQKIQKYFNLDKMLLETDAGEQIHNARKTIANYAKANDIFIKIEQHKSPVSKNVTYPKRMAISVSSMKNKSDYDNFCSVIDTDTNVVYPITRERRFVLPVEGEDVEIARKSTSFAEDTFLRHVYRTIEHLKKDVVQTIQTKK